MSKKKTPQISWPTSYVSRLPIEKTPPEVKRWLRRVFHRQLYATDHLTLSLSTYDSDEKRRRKIKQTLHQAGLTNKQIQQLLKYLPD